MKLIGKFLSVCIAIILTISFLQPADAAVVLFQDDAKLTEVKFYSSATIDDDFADDRLIIVFNNETSIEFNDYTSKDFSEVSVAAVDDLTQHTKSMFKNSNAKTILDTQEINYSQSKLDNFNQIISVQLKNSGKENVLKAIKTLESRKDILYVGPDYLIGVSAKESNDSYADIQWALNTIDLPEAWDITTGNSSVIVGVMDTGIDSNHEDLSNRINQSLNRDFTSGTIQTVTVPTDPNGHGTHVAGIIGAYGNNSIGISGVCWNVQLASLRVFDNEGRGYSSNAVRAIDFATSANIPIINFSARWYAVSERFDVAMSTAIANYPGLFICASGNEGKNNNHEEIFPTNYGINNLISVANTTSNDVLNSSSNYGSLTVHLAAPGTDVYSCKPSNGYRFMTGTSMAAPHVAGVAALILSIRPDLSPTEVKKLILDNVDKLDSLSGKCITGGRLNAYKAVRAATEHRTLTGDVNGDNRTDMILSRNINGKRALTVFLGKSDGSFTEPVTTNSTRTFVYGDPAYVGDFNGDGKDDLLFHWRNSSTLKRQLLVYISKGNGTYYDGVNLSSIRVHDPINYPCSVHVNDVNGDGKDDFIVVFRNPSGYVNILIYKGTSASPYLLDAASYSLTTTDEYGLDESAYTGDFNGDGYGDILVHLKSASGKRQLRVYTGRSDGMFNAGADLISVRAHDLATYPSKFFVTDVNGDGKDDFVVHWKNDYGKRSNIVYFGKAASPYIIDTTANALTSTNNYIETDPVFVGDINGDGRNDMVVHWGNNDLRQLLSYTVKTDGTYNSAVNYSTINAYDPALYADRYFVSDVNGDGRDDFIVKWKNNTDGRVCFLTYLGTAAGSFTAAVRTEPTANISYYS